MPKKIIAIFFSLFIICPKVSADEVCTWLEKVVDAIPAQFKEHAYNCDDDFCETRLKPTSATDCTSQNEYENGAKYGDLYCDWEFWVDDLESGKQSYLSFSKEVEGCLYRIMSHRKYSTIQQEKDQALYDGINISHDGMGSQYMTEGHTIQFSSQGFADITVSIEVEDIEQGFRKREASISVGVISIDPWMYYVRGYD